MASDASAMSSASIRTRRNANAQRRAQLLRELDAELTLLEQREDDHPKAACALMASRRYRPLSERGLARSAAAGPRQDQGGGEVRRQVRGDQQRRHAVGRGHRSRLQRRLDHRVLLPPYEADRARGATDVSLDAAPDRGARQALRAGACRCNGPLRSAARSPGRASPTRLAQLKAVRYRSDSRTIVQRTKITAALAETLKKLGISMPKQILSIDEPAQTADAA